MLTYTNLNNRVKKIEFFNYIKGYRMFLVLLHHSRVPHGEYILVFYMPHKSYIGKDDVLCI